MRFAEKIGMVVALLGLLLLLGTEDSGATVGNLFSGTTVLGAGLALLSAITFGLFSTTRRSHSSDVRDAELCFYFLLMAGVVCGFVAMLPVGSSIVSRADNSSFGVAILLQLIGAVLTVTSSLLLSRVYRSNQTARISLVLMTEPLFSAALGYLFFAETFSALQLMGAGVMFCGLLAGALGSALSFRNRPAAQVA
jgi:drug/metabolite transporter (DMT)-like permease